MTQDAAVGFLVLPADPASVPVARRLVRQVLPGHHQDLVSTVELCLSELVTNAVLHARTEVEVRLEDLGEKIRLEVRDRCPSIPRRLVHTVRSATGRGMEMVSLLARAWGVDLVEADAKSVWCELDVAAHAPGAVPTAPDELLAAWADEADPFVAAWAGETDPVLTPAVAEVTEPAAAQGGETAHYVLLGYPVALGIRMREHSSAILRECSLLTQGASQTSAPARLIAIAELLTTTSAGALAAASDERMHAFLEGRTTMDVRYPVMPDALEAARSWQQLMDELDAFAESNALLTIATPPDLVQLRRWTVEQVTRQSHNLPPQRWSGALG